MAKKKKPLDQYLKSRGERVAKTVRLPEELWQQVDDLAELHNTTANNVIEAALEKAVDEEAASK